MAYTTNVAGLMKALVIQAPGEYEVKQVKKPECPEKGILLRVMACGLCGSDLRILNSGHKNISFPWTTGHEIAGVVTQIGDKYQGKWKEGDLLAVAPVVYCGVCDFCELGKYELCDNIKEIAHQWLGGFAEFIAIPEEALRLGTIQAVPHGLDPIIAAVAEPISSCVNAQEKGQVGLGDTVVIIGSGPIGCANTSIAKARGASRVIIADMFEERLQLCDPFKPDFKINASEVNLVDEVMKVTNGRGADVVITANSAPISQVQAIEMARKGGRVLLFGGLPPDKSKPGIDGNLIHYRGLHVIGTTSFAPRHHKLALSMITSGRIPGDKFVTHFMPLTEFDKGVALATSGKALKVVFIP